MLNDVLLDRLPLLAWAVRNGRGDTSAQAMDECKLKVVALGAGTYRGTSLGSSLKYLA